MSLKSVSRETTTMLSFNPFVFRADVFEERMSNCVGQLFLHQQEILRQTQNEQNRFNRESYVTRDDIKEENVFDEYVRKTDNTMSVTTILTDVTTCLVSVEVYGYREYSRRD